jgi:tetratricopeptide (TPR) repeat protein
VGLALNARTILTGRVVQQGEVLNIQAELVDTATESQLWGEQFRQNVSDLVTVQEEIAWHISEALRLKLTGAQKKRLKKRHTASADASRAYLRGRFEWNSWTGDGFRRAVEHFEEAIEHDPRFAAAYAGLSDSYGAMAYYGFVPAGVGYPRALEAAQKALAMDPDNADAHASLALGCLLWRMDWAGAEREFTTALKLNPQLATAHATYSLYLTVMGRHEEAIAQSRAAQSIDPISLLVNMTVCWSLHFADRLEEAVRETRRTRELAPGFHEAGNLLMHLFERLGKFEDAARVALEQPVYGVPMDGAALGEAYRRGGREAYLRQRIAELNASQSHVPAAIHYGYAVVHAQLDEQDVAVHHLERLVEARSSNAVFIGVEPCFKTLRGHAGYRALLKRLDLPMASVPHTVST